MTDHAATASRDFVGAASPAAAPRLDDTMSFRIVMALCLVLACVLTFGRIQAVWTTGAFFDSDDALRAVQVRDYLAGQGWFDLVARRIDPPGGLPMHWSRIVDVPLAGLMRLFSLFLSPDYAERTARLVFPFALLGVLFALVGRLATILHDRTARLAAVWLALLSGAIFIQFAPGHIDHHAPQIVTLVAALCFFLRGLDPSRGWRMAPAAALMALSVAISLENLPFFVVMIAALPVLFIVDGAAGPLVGFAAGALIAFPAFYAATVPGVAYYDSACDAFSFVHLAAIVIGAAGLGLLGLLAKWLKAPGARFAGVIAVGGATALAVARIAPRCVGDPLDNLDPVLRDLWLSHVVEASPLMSFYAKSPGIVIATAGPVLLGFVAALMLAWRAQDNVARHRYGVLAAIIAVGFAGGLWQVRVFTSVTPLAMAPLAVALVASLRPLPISAPLRGLVVALLAAFVSPVGLAVALPSPDNEESGETCLAPAHYRTLATLPPGRVVGVFDFGSHIVAHTPHSAFAAPYHRDNHGNLVAARAFMAEPAEAERLLREAGADYVIWCARQKPLSPLAARAPNGLAAMLAKGAAPGWLERKSEPGAKLLVFALKPAEK